jgi:hypothetical protein
MSDNTSDVCPGIVKIALASCQEAVCRRSAFTGPRQPVREVVVVARPGASSEPRAADDGRAAIGHQHGRCACIVRPQPSEVPLDDATEGAYGQDV